jgi:hypothetical protein
MPPAIFRTSSAGFPSTTFFSAATPASFAASSTYLVALLPFLHHRLPEVLGNLVGYVGADVR